MTELDYQSGPSVEVFTAQIKDYSTFWKLSNLNQNNDLKIFDPDLKSYVFQLDGNNGLARIQSKNTFKLVQRFLVLQVVIPLSRDFSIELGVQDLKNKRRITLSTNNRSINITPMHTKLPLGLVIRDQWMNLCLDMVSLVRESWKGQTFSCLQSIGITGGCRLRRIITMKSQLLDNTDDDERYGCSNTNDGVEIDSLPRQFISSNIQVTQVLNVEKLQHYVSCYIPNPQSKSSRTESSQPKSSRNESSQLKSSRSESSQPKTSRNESHSNRHRSSSQSREGSGQKANREGHRGSNSKDPTKNGSARDGSSHRAVQRDGSQSRGQSSREGSAQKGTPNREGSATKATSSREGSAQKRTSSREGSAHKNYSSREGSAQKGYSSREGSHKASSRETSAQKDSRVYVDTSSRESSATKGSSSREGSGQASERVKGSRQQQSKQHHLRSKSDTESLRTSRTWTDGADGVTDIPYVKVKPHAPTEPFSAKHRRPRPGVKSAGKERTPHAGHVQYKHEKAPDEPMAQPTQIANDDEEEAILKAMQESHRRSVLRHHHESTTTSEDNSYGRDDNDVMRAISLLNQHRPPPPRSDTSDTTTGTHEYEESDEDDLSHQKKEKVYSFSSKPRISRNAEPQNRRNNHVKSQYTKDRKKSSLKSSDQESEICLDSMGHQEKNYLNNNRRTSNVSGRGEGNGARKNRRQSDNVDESSITDNSSSRERYRDSNMHRKEQQANRHTADVSVTSQSRQRLRHNHIEALSSEEEPQISRKQYRPYHKPQQRTRYGAKNSQLTAVHNSHQSQTPRQNGANHSHTRNDPSSNFDPRIEQRTMETSTPSGIFLHVPTNFEDANAHLEDTGETMRQQPLSISRKSLREIPGPSDDMHSSGGLRPYNPVHYQNGGGAVGVELCDSAELDYLQNVRKGESDDHSDQELSSQESENESSDHTEQNTLEMRGSSRFRYQNPDEMEGTSSTLVNSMPQEVEPYSYEDEMRMMQSHGDGFLTKSNVGGLLSEMALSRTPDPPSIQPQAFPKHRPDSPDDIHRRYERHLQNGVDGGSHGSTGTCTDEDEELLELYYDPVLNCYFDPTTYKYYELA